MGNAYTQDCFSHDICSYFNSASGGARFVVLLPFFDGTGAKDVSDPNCGAAYNAAIDDTTFGVANGCGKSNPSNSVSKPSGQPTCV